jgi:YVTN family beta-propeller protein
VLSSGFLFGANFNARNVTVAALDGSSLDLVDPTGGASVAGPCEIVRSPDRSRIFVADEFNGSVHVLDAETRLVTASLPIGVEPCALAAIDTARLLVASTQTDQVAVIDADDPGAVPEPASTGPLGFVLETAVDPDASRAFLLVQLGYFSFEDPELELVVLDLDPLAEVERIPFEFPRDGRATDLALVPGTELVLVSTDRSVLFVPEAARPAAPLGLAAAGALALEGRRRRGTRRVERLARTC